MDYPRDDGSTLREHLMKVEEQTAKTPKPFHDPRLDDVVIPDGAEHLWNDFWDLNSTRRGGMDGSPFLSQTEIRDWQFNTKTELRPSDIEIIRAMDAAYVKFINEQYKKKRRK